MSEHKLERFEKYLLLDHLVDGGMAKICRARYLSEDAYKIVAIKMVQPQFSKDENFRKMFMDEIKVALMLTHPNIAATERCGEHKGQLYTAMEYVDGKNLKEYIDEISSKNFVFPVSKAVYIVSQACIGLNYAHTLKDKLTGKPLKIVHRDISPHNIMLTYDGGVKVIDFGIAKAETNSDATQVGTIKGKLSYLAPEYLDGKELDERYDEFALGITLWEMLCGRKLFKGKNEMHVLKQISACKILPPSHYNGTVPKELDDIVMKALSKDRNDRYENCDQFNRALVQFLYSFEPTFNPMDLKKFAQAVFKAEIKKDKAKFFEFGKVDIKPYLEDAKNEDKAAPDGPKLEVTASDLSDTGQRKESRVLDFGFEEEEDSALFSKKDKTATALGIEQTSVTKLKKKAGGTQVRKNTIGGTKSGSRTKTGTRTGTRSGTRTGISEKQKKSNTGPLIILFIVMALFGFYYTSNKSEVHETVTSLTGIEFEKKAKFELDDDTGEDDIVGNFQASRSKSIGLIQIDNLKNQGQRVYVNNIRVNPSIMGEIETEFSNEIILRVEERGRKHFVKKFSLSEGSDSVEISIPTMPRTSYAYLTTSRRCVTGRLFLTIFGEDRVFNLPINQKPGVAYPLAVDPLSKEVQTEYEAVYEISGDKNLKRKVKFKVMYADEIVDLCNFTSAY